MGNILAFTPGWCLEFDDYSSLEDKLFWGTVWEENWLLFKLTFVTIIHCASAPFHLLLLAPRFVNYATFHRREVSTLRKAVRRWGKERGL